MSADGHDQELPGALGAVPDPEFETTPTRVKRKVTETVDHAEAIAARAIGAERAGRLGASARDAVDRGEDLYFSALDRVDAQLRDRPYQTLGLTLGLGLVIGFLLAGNRRTVIYRAR